MHISSLSIRNFRNFKNANFTFQSGINTLIGENGAGKTNVFYALRILLDDELPRRIKFSANDFNRALGNWQGHWIIISVKFENLDVSEEAQALAIQAHGHMDEDATGSYSVYFRPKYDFRKKLHEYSQQGDKNTEGLNLLLNSVTLDDYEAIYLGRGSADFSNDDIYSKYVGNFESIEFPNPDDNEDLIFGTWLPKEINIVNEVSCTFIKALRDVESDLKSYTNNPLVNLLKGKGKNIEIETQEEIIEKIDALNEQIGSLTEVKEIQKGIDNSIKQAVGTTYAPNIEIKSELPNDVEKLLQSLKLWVGDPDDEGYKGRIWELSLGGANIIYLSLKLLEYEKTKSDKIANFILIEEPEAHIHTHIQKTLFENLKENDTQIIVSTHSTHISSVSKISSLNIISRGDKESLVFNPSKNLDAGLVKRLERYLDAVRSNLLFAKGVILVEGDAEQILVPEMFKTVFGLSLDEIGVSLINVGSTSFENIANIFHSDRVKRNCSILTDLDQSIVVLPKDPSADNTIQKRCRASEISGKQRAQTLKDYCKGNEFIKPFFAKNTFEVDLLMNGNRHEFTNCLSQIYSKDADIKKSKKLINEEDVEIAGLEVLRLAKKNGKGWFALLLLEELLYNTFIPDYILKAIAFASSHINLSSKAKSIRYRISLIRNNEHDEYYKEAQSFSMRGKNEEKLVQDFIERFPNDQLSIFLGIL